MGEKVIGTPDKIFKTESGGQNVKSENVIVESNKDQGEKNDKGLTVPFESFQPILYVFGETTFKIANPKYLFALKERHFRKKQDDTRDPIDIEVLHNILLYLKMDPMERIRNGT